MGKNKSVPRDGSRMSASVRFKQFLMVTGLLTVLAVVAVVGLLVYLWLDSGDVSSELPE